MPSTVKTETELKKDTADEKERKNKFINEKEVRNEQVFTSSSSVLIARQRLSIHVTANTQQ
jgi:hypothetical protein